MNIEKELKKEGIEVIAKLDNLIREDIIKNIARRIYESFPNYEFTEEDLKNKLSNLEMYRASMVEGMAEASYFYKNTSIYFNEHISIEDMEEFAIHECIHYLQEIKDEKNKLIRMGLCNYKGHKAVGLGLNEAGVQYTASHIIGIDADFEKYYGISLITPSPSYYPLECSLLNEITYFTGNDVLFKSIFFSNDSFKECVVALSSEKTYNELIKVFDIIINCEEQLVKYSNKSSLLEDGSSKCERLTLKIEKIKKKIANSYIEAQNLIIRSFFDKGFENISDLESLETFRHKIYKFSSIIGSVEDYKFFDNYYVEMMNKLEHKCNVLENGGVETALTKSSHNPIIEFFKKIFGISAKKRELN